MLQLKPSDVKSQLIGKGPDAGKDWRWEKGTTEDEMAGWHHRLDAHGFGWTLGVGDGQEGLACCDSWGHKELATAEQLNWTEFMIDFLELCSYLKIWGRWKNLTYKLFTVFEYFMNISFNNQWSMTMLIKYLFTSICGFLLVFWNQLFFF